MQHSTENISCTTEIIFNTQANYTFATTLPSQFVYVQIRIKAHVTTAYGTRRMSTSDCRLPTREPTNHALPLSLSPNQLAIYRRLSHTTG